MLLSTFYYAHFYQILYEDTSWGYNYLICTAFFYTFITLHCSTEFCLADNCQLIIQSNIMFPHADFNETRTKSLAIPDNMGLTTVYELSSI